jgi:hypothetical protein
MGTAITATAATIKENAAKAAKAAALWQQLLKYQQSLDFSCYFSCKGELQ